MIYDGLDENKKIVDEAVFTAFMFDNFGGEIVFEGRSTFCNDGSYKILSLSKPGITLRYWRASCDDRVNITAFGKEDKIGDVEKIISERFPKSI